jgi:electron transport complex protein RnfG
MIIAMKKIILSMLLLASFAAVQADDVMRKEKDGTYVINTTTLAKDVDGYVGPTPVEVYIKKNKIVKVVMLKSQETPKYNARVKKEMLPSYENQKVVKGKTVEVDGVTQATFTSNAVKENVKRALEYYWKHK